ncbi:MAG: type II toxin-antitoxin system RelE/ParE family toxin [Syntrophobacteraceae bacterium]
MAPYKVLLASSVKQDVRGIDRNNLARILDEIHSLSDNPFPSGCKKLKGSRSSYRLRVGDYRILYEVDTEAGAVSVYRVRHRKDVYQK